MGERMPKQMDIEDKHQVPPRFPLEKHDHESGLLLADDKAAKAQVPEHQKPVDTSLIGQILHYTLTEKDLKDGRSAGEVRPAMVTFISPDVYKPGQEHTFRTHVPAQEGRVGVPAKDGREAVVALPRKEAHVIDEKKAIPPGHGYSVTVFLNGHGISPDGSGDGPETLWRHGLAIFDAPTSGGLHHPTKPGMVQGPPDLTPEERRALQLREQPDAKR
jgi:hypothetical protein